MLTLKQVNAEIEKNYPGVFLVKGNGYFYLASNDDKIGLALATLYTTSIGLFAIDHLPLDRWMQEVKAVLNDEQRHPSERSPVYPEKRKSKSCSYAKIECNGVTIYFDGVYNLQTDTLTVLRYYGDVSIKVEAFQNFAIENNIANVIFK